MINLYLDIETLPAVWTDDEKIAAARAAVPGNYSKPDTIEKWIAEHVDEVHRKTAIDWRTCRILCIGYATDADPATTIYSATADFAPLLDGLAAAIDAAIVRNRGASVRFVGHNLLGFDLPRLRLLAAKHHHPVLHMLPSERYDRRAVDTMALISGPDPRAIPFPSLADISAYLGLSDKGEGLDGSMVYDAWLAGEHERIARYCAQDVELCRAVYLAMGGA